ncbi:carboxyl-terminal peptidase [Trema orientale]|uniref:Carboxyl-terminal peptidase n=1 Tax=Trema orientale TaxID=63057 RepID=A0A2P5EGF1_TREOI|nr:carboxyl-terminal peptidase [Trema orientale]
MAARDCKDIKAMFGAICAIILVTNSLQVWGRLPIKEDMELDRQLELINKPPLKSFQMKPKTTPKEMGNEASRAYKSSNYMPKHIKCPPGSVPIKRAKKEDLIMAESTNSLGLNHPTNTPWRCSNGGNGGHHFAVLEHKSQMYGTRARINIWNPSVKDHQFSIGGMWIANGPKHDINSIQAGWIVHKDLFPNGSRLYTYWTGDGYQRTGCFNVLCPGFVQVSSVIALGLILPHSTFNGSQSDMLLSVYQDHASGHWWLMFEDKYVGYWPKAIVPRLGDGAGSVSWGGQIYSPVTVLSPEMGSGHFPEEPYRVNYRIAAYIIQIKVVHDERDKTKFDNPKDDALKIVVDKPNCYKARHLVDEAAGLGHHVYFGGPGTCTY